MPCRFYRVTISHSHQQTMNLMNIFSTNQMQYKMFHFDNNKKIIYNSILTKSTGTYVKLIMFSAHNENKEYEIIPSTT